MTATATTSSSVLSPAALAGIESYAREWAGADRPCAMKTAAEDLLRLAARCRELEAENAGLRDRVAELEAAEVDDALCSAAEFHALVRMGLSHTAA